MIASLQIAVPAARNLGRIIRRAQDAIALLEIRREVALIECMIPAGDEVDPDLEEVGRGLRRDAEASRDVLTVDNTGIDGILLAGKCKTTFERISSRRPNDVAKYEQVQRCYRRPVAFPFFRVLIK